MKSQLVFTVTRKKELNKEAYELLSEFRRNNIFSDPVAVSECINAFIKNSNKALVLVTPSDVAENPRSKYHLLYNLSSAKMFFA